MTYKQFQPMTGRFFTRGDPGGLRTHDLCSGGKRRNPLSGRSHGMAYPSLLTALVTVYVLFLLVFSLK